ncbi:MAG: hypothetical protein JW850_10425 [Thermoflexales bacterium]|nr:hypothetical protein [Thermoflexales bacterium]
MPGQVTFKSSRLVKPTVDTPFHIDFDWWERSGGNLRVYMRSHLCPTHRDMYAEVSNVSQIDWIDPYTAEVKQVDGLVFQLRTHCSRQSGYITSSTAVVDAIFRVFLVNDNEPLSPNELSEKIGKRADLILKTISGREVYRGLRPVLG